MKQLTTHVLILLFTTLIMAAPVKAEAATISGSQPLGGFSKALDDYYTKRAEGDTTMTALLERAEEIRRQTEILCRIVEA